jgi:hypothetical protein
LHQLTRKTSRCETSRYNGNFFQAYFSF